MSSEHSQPRSRPGGASGSSAPANLGIVCQETHTQPGPAGTKALLDAPALPRIPLSAPGRVWSAPCSWPGPSLHLLQVCRQSFGELLDALPAAWRRSQSEDAALKSKLRGRCTPRSPPGCLIWALRVGNPHSHRCFPAEPGVAQQQPLPTVPPRVPKLSVLDTSFRALSSK